MISIIIPCYGASEYLEDISSDLIKQSFKDFEVLFINDGDYRQDIVLETIAKKDLRFRCINKINGGVGSARNLGLKYVKGEWVVFVDPDDRLECFYLETLYSSVCKNDVELGVGGFRLATNRSLINCINYYIDETIVNKDALPFKEYFDYIEYKNYHRSLWNKIYEYKIIKEYEISFDETIHIAEDWQFNLEYYAHTSYVRLIPNCGYSYIWGNSGSLMHSYIPDTVTSRMMIIDKITTIRQLIGRSNDIVIKQRVDDLSVLSFEIIKNLFCTRNCPSLNLVEKFINDEILANKDVMSAVQQSNPSKLANRIQKKLLLTSNSKIITYSHWLLYLINNAIKKTRL